MAMHMSLRFAWHSDERNGHIRISAAIPIAWDSLKYCNRLNIK